MTPKEKAQELFNKMHFADDPMGKYPMCFETAKQCALIAVDEIIIEITDNYDSLHAIDQALYWQQVKIEIEKL